MDHESEGVVTFKDFIEVYGLGVEVESHIWNEYI